MSTKVAKHKVLKMLNFDGEFLVMVLALLLMIIGGIGYDVYRNSVWTNVIDTAMYLILADAVITGLQTIVGMLKERDDK